MTTPPWVQDAIFYQIFPDRFARSPRMPDLGFEPWDAPPTNHGFKGGDLYGIVEKLDYLNDLGITALYLNPVFASASNHRYHTYDYYRVDPLLGGDDALRLLLDEAHNREMRVVLDGVFNHASRGFWQFHHVLENGQGSPFVDWFHFDPDRLNGNRPWGAYPTSQEEAAIQNEGSLQAIGYQGWWNLPALPKFNTDTPAVREFLFGVAEHWTQFGIDGWRLDVPGEIDDDAFWEEFRQRVKRINSEAYIVGEVWHEAGRWLQGDQFDAVMNYLVTAAVLSFCAGPNLDMDIARQAGGLAEHLRPGMQAQAFADEIDRLTGLYSPEITHSQLNLLDSHDMPRFLSSVSKDLPSLQLALLFLFTYPGAPCLFYGDEIGLTGRHDPDCRRSFPWDDARWNNSLFDYTKSLIALRNSYASSRRGSFEGLYAEAETYVFLRKLDQERILVALNAGDQLTQVKVALSGLADPFENPATIFGADVGAFLTDEGLSLNLPPRQGSVVRI